MTASPRRRPVIGLLLNSLFDGYEVGVWHGTIRAAEELDVDLLCFLGGSLGDGSGRSSLFELAGQGSVDAVVALSASVGDRSGPAEVAALLARMAPLPAVSLSEPLPGVPSVLADNAAGIAQAMQHLAVEHGRRRIAYVGGPGTSTEAHLRYQAYREALARFELPFDPALVLDGDWGPRSGVHAIRTLEARRASCDAVLASNDLMALAALDELCRSGVDVPGQVAVCGFDDVSDAAGASPPLTTVRQPLAGMARAAVQAALALARGEAVEPRRLFPAELVVRQSCGCACVAAEPAAIPPHRPARADEEVRLLHRLIQPFPLPEDAFLGKLLSTLDVLGVRSFFLCRYLDDDLREAALIAYRDLDGVAALDARTARFPSAELVPGRFTGGRRRAHAVLPVQSPHGPIGYAVCEIGLMNASGYEVLMHQISTVLSMSGLVGQLREQQHQVLEVARHAGMAEMAVGTLHNVGNVLNTVSVCAEQVAALAGVSTADGLRRAVQLLLAQRGDLPGFFVRDERAPLLAEYLDRSSEHLLQERTLIEREAQLLLEKVAVIRDTVRALQEVAREGHGRALLERIDLRALVTAALQNQAAFLARHRVAVDEQLGDDEAPVVTDRGKLLHVLINLVKNAAEAMRGAGDGARSLCVRIAAAGDRIRLTLSDTGEGIAPENLDKVFSFGFTTKPDGHGFGLHTCALYARELGGSLVASSPGRGRGATFTLELPGEPAGGAAREVAGG